MGVKHKNRCLVPFRDRLIAQERNEHLRSAAPENFLRMAEQIQSVLLDLLNAGASHQIVKLSKKDILPSHCEIGSGIISFIAPPSDGGIFLHGGHQVFEAAVAHLEGLHRGIAAFKNRFKIAGHNSERPPVTQAQ